MHHSLTIYIYMSWIWFPLTSNCTSPLDYISHSCNCTHTFPSTITPITQLSTIHSSTLIALTTPAPHLLTHIKAAHKHSPSAKSCFCPGYIYERSSPYLLSLCVTPDSARTIDSLNLLPVTSTSGLVLFTSLLCLWYSCYAPLTIACVILLAV